MTDLLDAAISNTKTNRGPTIVSENHNLGSINWAAGLSDPGEMISCGYMPEARRLSNESDEVYQTRLIAMDLPTILGPARMKQLINAAIKRAGLDVSTGKVAMMSAGLKTAWHGLGVQVEEAVTSADAIRLASLDWKVIKQQLRYADPSTGEMRDAEGNFGIVREDTGALLGTVGKVYQPFQNSEGFAFLDKILDQFEAKYETAGAIYGGSRVWMLVKLPKQAFSVTPEDRIEPYALFINSHDGTSAARCFPTSQRVVCRNTMRLALNEKDKGISIRHAGDLKAHVASAQNALGLAVQRVEKYKEDAEVLSRAKVEPVPYFEGLLDAVLEVTKAEALMGADALAAAVAMTEAEQIVKTSHYKREIEKRETLLEDVLSRYESGTNAVSGMRGTGWSALQAVTESANHGELGGRYKGKEKDSRRFENIVMGEADRISQVAYQQVMSLAG